MLPIRLIATDLDGTLLRSDSTLSDRTRETLRAARAAGLRVVAATARPARVIDELFGDDDLIDVALCGNGAAHYLPGDRRLVITHPMPADLTRQVIALISEIEPGAGFAVEDGHRVLFDPRYDYRPTMDHDREPVQETEALLVGSIVKLMVWLPDRDPAAAWARLRSSLDPLVSCTWSAERAPLEIAVKEVSKAAALAELCTAWQIEPAEVIAFGDSVNDLSMLAWAGRAYAVANADPAVLAATASHAWSNDDDGVARVLERLLEAGRDLVDASTG